MATTLFKIKVCLYALATNMLLQQCCFGHDNITIHPAISESAARSSEALKLFLAGYFGTSAALALDQPRLSLHPEIFGYYELTPITWLKEGSKEEDLPTLRVLNHFYNPGKKPAEGLTDPTAVGCNSFQLASDPSLAKDAEGGIHTCLLP